MKEAGGRLSPADGHSAELIDALPAGKVYGATIKRKRNVQHLKKYWALIDAVWPAQALYPTSKRLGNAIKRACGLVDENLDPVTLKPYDEVGSIAFDAMEQDEFEEFFSRAVDLICNHILPGVGREDLRRRVDDILEGRAK